MELTVTNNSAITIVVICNLWCTTPSHTFKAKLSHYAPWRHLGEEEVLLLLILDLGTRWGEWSASCSGHALAPARGPRYPLYRRLGGPQSWSGHRGYRKHPFASVGDRTSIALSSSPQPDTILTALPGSPHTLKGNLLYQ
jgi:hypothetical protein